MSRQETIDNFEDFFELLLRVDARWIEIRRVETPSVKVHTEHAALLTWDHPIHATMGVNADGYAVRVDEIKQAYTEYRLEHTDISTINVIRHDSGNVYLSDDKGRGVNCRMFSQILGMLGFKTLDLGKMDRIMNCDYLLLKNILDAKKKLNWVENRILEGMR